MASELVPDLLNGLVAAGTLALAGATVYTVRVAVRGGLDASAPQVVVDSFRVMDKAVSDPGRRVGDLPHIEPGTDWVLATQGGLPIGLKAMGQLRNEGERTGLIRFVHGTDVEILGVAPSQGQMIGGLSRQGDWYVLTPGTAARYSLVWWRTASDWATSSDLPSAPVMKIRIVVRGMSGSIRDHCGLSFGGPVMARQPDGDGWIVAPVNSGKAEVAGTVPPRLATIGLMKRSYPSLFRHQVPYK